MRTQLRAAVAIFAGLTLITGAVYPLSVTAITQALFSWQANGSVVQVDGRAVGSALIGQPFGDIGYFWSRPSATEPFAYNAAASAGSNLGPTNPMLLRLVQARVDALRASDPGNTLPIPVDLVTASASGLDPHISVAAALYQVPRVALARGLSVDQVTAIVWQQTEGRLFWVLGESRVNVLALNLALDGKKSGNGLE